MEQVRRATGPDLNFRQATKKSGVSGGSSGISVLSGTVTAEKAVTSRPVQKIAHIQTR